MIPYGYQNIDNTDIKAVLKTLKSDFACEMVERYHSKKDAEAAIAHFEKLFSKKETRLDKFKDKSSYSKDQKPQS